MENNLVMNWCAKKIFVCHVKYLASVDRKKILTFALRSERNLFFFFLLLVAVTWLVVVNENFFLLSWRVIVLETKSQCRQWIYQPVFLLLFSSSVSIKLQDRTNKMNWNSLKSESLALPRKLKMTMIKKRKKMNFLNHQK